MNRVDRLGEEPSSFLGGVGCIWLDVGELLARGNDTRLSGILRSLLSVAAEFLKMQAAGEQIRFCRFLPGVGFVEVSNGAVQPVIERLLGPSDDVHLHALSAHVPRQEEIHRRESIVVHLRAALTRLRSTSRELARFVYLRLSSAVAPRTSEPPASIRARLRRFCRRCECWFLRRGLNANKIFRDNDILLNVGASWVQGAYPQAIEEIRRHTDLRFVLLIHDVIPWRVPLYCTMTTIAEFVPWMQRASLSANKLLTVSENSRRDILAFLKASHIPEKETIVIRWGRPRHADRNKGNPAELEQPQPGFVLCVGTIEVRKNHLLLVRAWSELLRRYGRWRVPDLVLIGQRGWMVDRLMQEFAETKHLDGKLIWHGDHEGVSEVALDTLYRNCLFTMFPSFYEGWGLPVAESLSYGKLCIASNAASITEIGGDLVDYHAPYDLDGCVALTERAIFDSDYRTAREERILREFRPPGWTECAQKIIAACRSLEKETVPATSTNLGGLPAV